MPGILSNPNIWDKDGRRTSPSISKVLCWVLRARAQARLPETVLFPSCGIVLVISNFLSARSRRRCCRLIPKNRNFSAARLSLSVRHTSRLCGGITTSRDWNWPNTSERWLSSKRSDCPVASTAVAAGCGSPCIAVSRCETA